MIRRWMTGTVTMALLLGMAMPIASAESTPPAPDATAPAPGPGPAPTPAPAVPLADYIDVPPAHWAYSYVMKLRQENIVAMDASGEFRPGAQIRRSELLKMLLAARRIDVGKECSGLFDDVPCTAWFAPAVETAYRMAIAEGAWYRTFLPDERVTREELIAFTLRALGHRWDVAKQQWSDINDLLKGFSDQGQISYFAKPYVAFALKQGLVTGYPDGTFRPKAATSRAEAAVMINRVLLPSTGMGTVTVGDRTVVYKKESLMTATAYTTGEPGVGTITYTGVTVRRGAIAVDPTVIPLGRLLYVEGYGYGAAVDIGGDIKGEWVDLFTYDWNEAVYHFGKQKRRVWVLP